MAATVSAAAAAPGAILQHNQRQPVPLTPPLRRDDTVGTKEWNNACIAPTRGQGGDDPAEMKGWMNATIASIRGRVQRKEQGSDDLPGMKIWKTAFLSPTRGQEGGGHGRRRGFGTPDALKKRQEKAMAPFVGVCGGGGSGGGGDSRKLRMGNMNTGTIASLAGGSCCSNRFGAAGGATGGEIGATGGVTGAKGGASVMTSGEAGAASGWMQIRTTATVATPIKATTTMKTAPTTTSSTTTTRTKTTKTTIPSAMSQEEIDEDAAYAAQLEKGELRAWAKERRSGRGSATKKARDTLETLRHRCVQASPDWRIVVLAHLRYVDDPSKVGGEGGGGYTGGYSTYERGAGEMYLLSCMAAVFRPYPPIPAMPRRKASGFYRQSSYRAHQARERGCTVFACGGRGEGQGNLYGADE